MGSGASPTSTHSCAVSSSATAESMGMPCEKERFQCVMRAASTASGPAVGGQRNTHQVHDPLAEQPRRELRGRPGVLPHLSPKLGQFPLRCIETSECHRQQGSERGWRADRLTACTTTAPRRSIVGRHAACGTRFPPNLVAWCRLHSILLNCANMVTEQLVPQNLINAIVPLWSAKLGHACGGLR